MNRANIFVISSNFQQDKKSWLKPLGDTSSPNLKVGVKLTPHVVVSVIAINPMLQHGDDRHSHGGFSLERQTIPP